jgi:shikimate kinase
LKRASVTTEEGGGGAIKELAGSVRGALGSRSIVLVGMMGSGKSSIGRRLALALDLPFADADAEIEIAAGMSIEEMFSTHGEPYFREGEERVIRRLLQSGPQIVSTGGGAVISAQTRAAIAQSGVSIWLDAPVDLLLQRVSRRDNRPLLKTGDPRAVLERLLGDRGKYYAEAHLKYESRDAPHETVVEEILALLSAHLSGGRRLETKHQEGS